ncbi:hypothetical protein [Caldibacillus sp. 210928-DFI.2.22]|uniref:hypothetical protein n=1 Tax=Caldibacillus sp. 210928-DFI.2.22 TaxID=2883265 RepID=UPI001D07DB89|nr:hypothetical protein [Caldibacillus sp. 210928-DFI.2.22]
MATRTSLVVKIDHFSPKMVTRANLVVKIGRFLPQNGDENRPRRQKTAFLSPNWRRDWVSSSKLSVFTSNW